jgi:diguanylate cyclase (GGDEF)-like protein
VRTPAIPKDEARRLHALRSLGVLDTPPEERFDRFTRLARRTFKVPIALVSLVDADRQWFKSRQGLEARETPRDISFCGHAILGQQTLVVNDAHEDARFADNPLVTHAPNIRFYAGRPITAPDGSPIGTFCLIDHQPRSLDADDLSLLDDLARMVEDEVAALELASVDELTGLSNRRAFQVLAEKSLAICRRQGCPATLLFLDLDDFKPINDRFGHDEGDCALREVADLLLETFRDSDVVARIGGDEFCVLLTGTSAVEMKQPIARMAESVRARNEAPGMRYALGYSVGVASLDPARPVSLVELVNEADRSMYEHKRAKRSDAGR